MATPETNPIYNLITGNNPRVVEQQNKYLYLFGFENEFDLYTWEMFANPDLFNDKTLEKKYINILKDAMKKNVRTNSSEIEKIFDYPENAKL